jgi:hypothetical protein
MYIELLSVVGVNGSWVLLLAHFIEFSARVVLIGVRQVNNMAYF